MFLFCRESTYSANFSGAKCLNTRDEILPIDLVDFHSQERIEGCDSCRMKNDLTPSTSKHDIQPNQWKVDVGKKGQTHSGPLVSSGMSTTLLPERGHTSERLMFYSFSSQTVTIIYE